MFKFKKKKCFLKHIYIFISAIKPEPRILLKKHNIILFGFK